MSRGDKNSPPTRSSCARRGEAITTVIVWLLLGAIVNIALAWGFGARARLPKPHPILPADEANELWGVHADAPPTGPVVGVRQESTFVTVTWFGTNLFVFPEGAGVGGFAPASPERYDILILDMGWPARSLSRLQTGVISPAVFFGRRIPIDNYVRWVSEARPTWPGFAINAVFYAAILWLLFAAPFALRRWRRIKRGLCPACGYRVGTSPVCTECGRVLPAPFEPIARRL